jgi:DNA-binding NtrC family response regulator
VTVVRVLVVELSGAFTRIWSQLPGAGVVVSFLSPDDPCATVQDVAAVVLAAGGAEHEARHWLDTQGVELACPVIVVGADPGRRTAISLILRGATDYFALPEDLELLRNALSTACERHRHAIRRAEELQQKAKDEAFSALVGESGTLKGTLARAAMILQRRDATALIVGETGTGKELLARAIHDGGPRRGAPFVAVNCSALPEHLVESELFGHERGAFTDAHAAKPGLFEVADGGTLFLDEVGTLPLDTQAKLLRVLEDKSIRRVGGTKSRTVDVRILAATNEDLDQAVKNGRFRNDLYFRLSVIVLRLPPLRERGEDVILISTALLQSVARQHGLPIPALTPEVRQALRGYHWPGNIRELKNAVERALLLSPQGELRSAELVPSGIASDAPGNGALPFPASLREINRTAARLMLEQCRGNRSHAAQRLGVSRQRLRRLIQSGQ